MKHRVAVLKTTKFSTTFVKNGAPRIFIIRSPAVSSRIGMRNMSITAWFVVSRATRMA